MNSKKKTYEKKEWKEKSREYVTDKSCEWCGRKAGDIVSVKDKEIKIYLVPHHRVKKQIGLRVYKRLANKMFGEYFKLGKNKEEREDLYDEARRSLISGAEVKDIKKRARFIWDQHHRDDLDTLYDDYKYGAEQDYLDLTPEKAMIFCNRCHFAREKGFVLCQKCRINYHKPIYPSCYNCSRSLRIDATD